MSWSGPAFTNVDIPPIPERITYADNILMIGSCFSEHIAARLGRYKYQVTQNPFGILYNPVALAESLYRIVTKKYYTAEELILHDGLFHSMDHHGSCSGINKESVVTSINDAIEQTYSHLTKCKFVFISPGTSWVYRYLPTRRIVGNCHKIPQAQFEKSKLAPEEVYEAFEKMYELIKKITPSARFIWTVSPVRHIRDGLIENQRSKAALILALEKMLNSHSDCNYFPAYEIMTDQLRDYRYYAKDLIHPSDTAIDIIWEIFSERYIHQKEIQVHGLIDTINQSMDHRFLHDRPEAISAFAKTQIERIERAASMIPGLNLSNEREYFDSLIQTQI